MIEYIDPEKCTGCGICAEVCPLDTLRIDPFQEESPPCRVACPAGADIRGVNHFLKNRVPREAARLLGKYLPYPAITGRLCHHPCESACARRDIDNAVNINGLERYVGDYGLKHGAEHPPRTHAGKAAVIGSGPAGLAAAYFLRGMGFGVTVFEASAEPGGMFREEVRHGRLQRDVLDAQIQFFTDMGVVFRTNTRLGQDVSLITLGEQLYQSVLLATGPGSQATDPIATDGNGSPVVDPVTQETSAKGVFAGGGLLLDRAPLVKVVDSAKRSTIFMARHLQHSDLSVPLDDKTKPVKRLPGHGIKAVPRQELPTDHTAHLFDTASAESRRCMTCGAKAFIAHPEDCMTCFYCDMGCPSGAVRVHPFKEVISCPIEYPAGGENHG